MFLAFGPTTFLIFYALLMMPGDMIDSIPSTLGVPWLTTAGLLNLIGIALILVALYRIGEKLGNKKPFNYYLYNVIASWIGNWIGGSIVAIIIFSAFSSEDASLGTIIMIFALAFIAVFAVGRYFTMRTWEEMRKTTGVGEFGWVAEVVKWGTLTVIALTACMEWVSILYTVGVYLVLVTIEVTLQALAFLRIPERGAEKQEENPALEQPVVF